MKRLNVHKLLISALEGLKTKQSLSSKRRAEKIELLNIKRSIYERRKD